MPESLDCRFAGKKTTQTAWINSSPRPYRFLGIVLVCLGIAEIDKNAVAHILRDEAT
jgi:hypothetical protein